MQEDCNTCFDIKQLTTRFTICQAKKKISLSAAKWKIFYTLKKLTAYITK